MTTLGHPEPVRDGVAPSVAYPFHEIEEEEYLACFQKYLLGGNSSIATTLEIDGETHILRAALGDMLRELLGRVPRKHELDAWFTAHDFDRTAVMEVGEYQRGVAMLREFSSTPRLPSEYTSFEVYRDHWLRHVRHDYEYTTTLKGPLTNAQEIGECAWRGMHTCVRAASGFKPCLSREALFPIIRRIAHIFFCLLLLCRLARAQTHAHRREAPRPQPDRRVQGRGENAG